MAILLSLTSVGIGDLEVLALSALPLGAHVVCRRSAEGSVTYLWQDEKTGALHHELV